MDCRAYRQNVPEIGDSLGLGYRFWQTLMYLPLLLLLTVQFDLMSTWVILDEVLRVLGFQMKLY